MPTDNIIRKSSNTLLLAFAKGNAGATRVLSKKLLPKVYAQALNHLDNQADAKDIAQEALVDCGVLHLTGKEMCQNINLALFVTDIFLLRSTTA